MEQLNQILANNLVKLRKSNNYTQSDIANLVAYSDKTVSKWETGEIIPNVENLIKLCNIYNVTLDEITKPIPDDKLQKNVNTNYDRQNKIIITLLAILAVWVIATVLFVYAKIIANISLWRAFIWAIPASCIILIIFNAIWGKRKYRFIIISVFIWTIITAIFLQFLDYNLFAIYFIGIPVQIAVLLWAGLKKPKRN